MNTSNCCEMYCTNLLKNNQTELAFVFEDHVRKIAYMLAGAICNAKHQYDFYVISSNISSVASEAANMLFNRLDDNPTCRQIPLLFTIIQLVIPQLGGQQTLTHRGMLQASKESSLLRHSIRETEAETTSDAQRRNSKRKKHGFSINKVVNSLISLWRKK